MKEYKAVQDLINKYIHLFTKEPEDLQEAKKLPCSMSMKEGTPVAVSP